MTVPAVQRRWTEEEYLEMERRSLEKHELFGGEVFAMAGAGFEHDIIIANLIQSLMNALGDRCLVFPSDMRVLVSATGLYTYPDVSVVCDEPDFQDAARDTLKNPLVLVEVLSPSTESYDRGKKFELYRGIPSFTDYVLVSSDRVLVEHFVRQPEGGWLLHEVRGGQTLRLPCGAVPVDALYRRLTLPVGPLR